jgi:hypothetical protein
MPRSAVCFVNASLWLRSIIALRILKQNNETIAKAFRKRLQEFAGFAYVPEPLG